MTSPLTLGACSADWLRDTSPVTEIAPRSDLADLSKQFLTNFATGRVNDGGTEAVNGIIELPRRIARGFRNPSNYPLEIIPRRKLTPPNLR